MVRSCRLSLLVLLGIVALAGCTETRVIHDGSLDHKFGGSVPSGSLMSNPRSMPGAPAEPGAWK